MEQRDIRNLLFNPFLPSDVGGGDTESASFKAGAAIYYCTEIRMELSNVRFFVRWPTATPIWYLLR